VQTDGCADRWTLSI